MGTFPIPPKRLAYPRHVRSRAERDSWPNNDVVAGCVFECSDTAAVTALHGFTGDAVGCLLEGAEIARPHREVTTGRQNNEKGPAEAIQQDLFTD